MRQSRIDIVIGVGLLFLCAFSAWRTLGIRPPIGGTIAGPSFLPWIMIGGLVLLSLMLIGRAVVRNDDGIRVDMPNRALLMKMAVFVLVMTAYAAAFMTVGYLPSTLCVFFAGLLLFGERRPPVLVLFPIIMTGIIYYGFTRALGVWLP
ncbi:MAG: tripartite tricarboxylate transporter TctB family protein [Rhodospirillaceae bacterium]|nr:tripartite tricarboxylate transporter TctB family protein [Rhodospirillaceae bacterium]